MSFVILLMVIYDIFEVLQVSVNVKSMMYYPTPLIWLNKGKPFSFPKNTKEDSKVENPKIVKMGTRATDLVRKNTANLNESKVGLNLEESIIWKREEIGPKPNRPNLAFRPSIDSNELNLLDVESIIKEDVGKMRESSSTLEQIVLNSDRNYSFSSQTSIKFDSKDTSPINRLQSPPIFSQRTENEQSQPKLALYVDCDKTLNFLQNNPGMCRFLFGELIYSDIILKKTTIRLQVFWYIARLACYNVTISTLNMSGNFCSLMLVIMELLYLIMQLYHHIKYKYYRTKIISIGRIL
jgi:hypothetical protein